MATTAPPQQYEDFIRVIHEDYQELSKTNQKIAEFLTQNPNDIAVKSVNDLAGLCGVHASSLVRFAQVFGYKGFKQLQGVFRQRLMTAAPGFEARANQLKSELGKTHIGGLRGFLKDLVVRDIASLEELLTESCEQDLENAIRILNDADHIYLLGQMRSEPIVNLLRYVLTMLGHRATLLDASGGLSTHMARVIKPGDALIVVSFRFYAKEVVSITEELSARGVPIVAISDSTLSPFAKSADVLFSIPEHEFTFSRSLAAPICLAQALMIGLASHSADGTGRQARIPVASATQDQPKSR